MKGQSWGCCMAVWMSGSLPLALRSGSGWGFLAWKWWEMGRGGDAEPHTCQMICHYRGVSSQLSPSNHPSYPSSQPPFTPQTPLQPSKNTFCIPQAAPVSLTALLPHLPLLSTLYPERKCTPARHKAHWAHCVDVRCMCMPHVCVSTQFPCMNTCLCKGRVVCFNTEGKPVEQNFTSGEHVNLVQAAVQKQNPRRQAKYRELSQVYYICQQQSFIATGHRSHSFPLNAASSGMCECARQILSH